MRNLRLLDLFSRAGGAARGYKRAGFHVTGVDLIPPAYEYGGDEFVQADAFEFLAEHGHKFDAWHASPPCQTFSTLTKGHRGRTAWQGDTHTDLIEPLRESLACVTTPGVIENVVGSPLRKDLVLCGLMFGLSVFRHRVFECVGWDCPTPPHPSHKGHRVSGWRHGVKHNGDMVAVYGHGGGKGDIPTWQRAMGIDWTTDRTELREAIPPAYTEYIGGYLLARCEADCSYRTAA